MSIFSPNCQKQFEQIFLSAALPLIEFILK